MSTEEKQAAFLHGLSIEVRTACDRWLKARGIAAPSFAGEYPGKTIQTSPAQPQTQETACQHTDPRREASKLHSFLPPTASGCSFRRAALKRFFRHTRI
jgi:hypothetical protein